MESKRCTLQEEVWVENKKHCFIQLEGTIALLTLAPAVRHTAGHSPFPVDSTSPTLPPHSTIPQTPPLHPLWDLYVMFLHLWSGTLGGAWYQDRQIEWLTDWLPVVQWPWLCLSISFILKMAWAFMSEYWYKCETAKPQKPKLDISCRAQKSKNEDNRWCSPRTNDALTKECCPVAEEWFP